MLSVCKLPDGSTYLTWVTLATGDLNRLLISSHLSPYCWIVVAMKNLLVYSWADDVADLIRLVINVSSAVVSTFKWVFASVNVYGLAVAGVTTLYALIVKFKKKGMGIKPPL